MEREVTINPIENNSTSLRNEEKINLPIKIANQISKSYFIGITSDDLYEAETALKLLTEIVQRVIRQNDKSGDANDWHNFAVDIARNDLFDLACDLLEGGLIVYPKNIDLLADYLQYGTSCGRIDRCKMFYKVLCKIPYIRWGWRGYSFSISYLTYLWECSDSEKELEKLQTEMLKISEEFRKNLPYEEESYRCEADIYKLLHKKKEEENVLRLALTNLKIAPKCALHLSDLLFERGDYEEALMHIQRGLKDAMQTQRSINEGYLYYLSGLTKMAIAQKESDFFSEPLACDIYADFDISLRQEPRAAYVNTMKAKTIVLVNRSGVSIPEKFEELIYLVQ